MEALIFLFSLMGFAMAWYQHNTSLVRTESRLLTRAYYFDDCYRVAVVHPVLTGAQRIARFDKHPIAAPDDAIEPHRSILNFSTLDGVFNSLGGGVQAIGEQSRRVQFGWLRGYIMILGLTIVCLLGMLAALRISRIDFEIH
jgi:hypothetical protein